MTDYIKRQAVTDYLDSNNMPWRDWVKDIPSADVVEVVRCRDCKYWYDRRICDYWSVENITQYTEKDNYCSKGERAEE